MEISYTIEGVTQQLHRKLKEYLETQYPISNLELQKKRSLLLDTPGVISTEPYIEATPVYELGETFDEINIPQAAKKLMKELAALSPSVGVFPRMYVHQQKAMEAFFTDHRDLIVATGTGSGKTETFLYPILNSLFIEATERQTHFTTRAVRALVLYPMNALVSDQITRLRRLFGDERIKQIFRDVGGRNVQFGMYTSRTPFPGYPTKRKIEKLKSELQYFRDLEDKHPKVAFQMKERGKWIAKDLDGLLKVAKNKFDNFQPNSNDAELYLRQEMQICPPDILVTNYSMLEYMLLRPIERSIWQKTREWLQADERNTFMLILDEAHMYRGTGGAEVAFLIRRLQSRLGITRDRIRCILTSASFASEEGAMLFAEKLTGKLDRRAFELIHGKPEKRSDPRPANIQEIEFLNALDAGKFMQYSKNYRQFLESFEFIWKSLNWKEPPAHARDFPEYLYTQLEGFGPLELIIRLISGHAASIKQIAEQLCPGCDLEIAQRVASHLLMLANVAKKNNRVLLSARVHIFFRGVQGLYICLNPKCSSQSGRISKSKYGQMYNSYRLSCDCGGRLFELVTHKKCGAAYIRGYYKPGSSNFYLWGEKGNAIVGDELEPIDLLIEQPHEDAIKKGRIRPLWLDIATGYIVGEPPSEEEVSQFVKVYAPLSKEDSKKKTGTQLSSSFDSCPCCLSRSKGAIMDLRTKGDKPFANLVREQYMLQAPVQGIDHPNEGRKVLLFSDGRQKAARLARDIPKEVEKDTLRQLLLLAATAAGTKYSIEKLYPAVLHFMKLHNVRLLDKTERLNLQADIEKYLRSIDEPIDEIDLKEVLNEMDDLQLRDELRKPLIEVIAAPGISLYDTTTGFVVPTRKSMIKLRNSLQCILTEDQIQTVAVMFIKDMLEDIAVDTRLKLRDRQEILGYMRHIDNWGKDHGWISDELDALITFYAASQHKDMIVNSLYDNLCKAHNGRHYLDTVYLAVNNGIDHIWYKCTTCRQIHAVTANRHCPNCLSEKLIEVSPSSDVLASERGYWRTPVEQVLKYGKQVRNITVEEHTAQLSQKDESEAFTTTEFYELAFQDIEIPDSNGIVDILSCTTTMEVGIDIGSLTAVGLRNIPPQRENYQQRAGRAGRRGSSLSTVITYAQDGPHDHHYFKQPEHIISGKPSETKIYTDNVKIARRHMNAVLLQTYFHEHASHENTFGSKINESLGRTFDFFEGEGPFNLESFSKWLDKLTPDVYTDILGVITEGFNDSQHLINQVISRLPNDLKLAYEMIRHEVADRNIEEDAELYGTSRNLYLLDFLFNHGFLPTYAFPHDLVSFYIQGRGRNGNFIIKHRPQQELNRALSEYSPGRQIVVDKKTYRIGGIYSPYAPNKAKPAAHYSFHNTVVFCDRCHFTKLGVEQVAICPTCQIPLKSMPYIRPEGFSPERGKNIEEWDDEEEISYCQGRI